MAAFLILETGMLGSLVALDAILFYVFWEVMLIPMYFIIGIWGGKRRIYATMKFVLFTLAGSLLMFVAILFASGVHARTTGILTFSLLEWIPAASTGAWGLTGTQEALLFWAFALAFLVKVPLWPLHTWLPDAHVEAPTGGSIILAGVLLKLGTYGLLRFAIPLFPGAAARYTPFIAVLALIGIVYGAWVAAAQKDMKKLVAYSSVSHLALVVLGIFAGNVTAVSGAVMQMVGHGLTTGLLFLLVGVLYERRHTREMADYGGVASQVPITTTLFVIAVLGSVGLPGPQRLRRRVPDPRRRLQGERRLGRGRGDGPHPRRHLPPHPRPEGLLGTEPGEGEPRAHRHQRLGVRRGVPDDRPRRRPRGLAAAGPRPRPQLRRDGRADRHRPDGPVTSAAERSC